MKTFLLLISAAIAAAQTPVGVGSRGCRGPNVQIPVTVPFVAGAITIPIQVCAELGPGIVLNTTATPPRLEVVSPPVAIPRAVVEKFPIPPATPAGPGTTLTVTLTQTPAASGVVLVSFRSSRVGGDAVEFVKPGGGANPRQLVVTLPDYRPFTVDDGLTVAYWTLD